AAANARPIPVLPEVLSIIVPPGLILPAFSAASSIIMPMRSFTLPPGLRYSSLASIVARTPRATRFRRTIGVLPITSRMLLCHIYLLVLRYHKQFFHSFFDAGQPLRCGRHRKIADIHVFHASFKKGMDAARANFFGSDLCFEVALQIRDGQGKESRQHIQRVCARTTVVENPKNAGNLDT